VASTIPVYLNVNLELILLHDFSLIQSELEFEPRYPLFGGWHCTFTIGYGMPLQDFLFESEDGRRFANLTFGCPLLNTVVDDLTIKVSLHKNPTLMKHTLINGQELE
jgi:hypothetical protein